MEPFERMKGRALVVVAHPDDETIWMGGTILSLQNIRWTIVSLSRGDDADRAPRFRAAARAYHARGIISDLEDEGIMTIRESIPEIRKRLRKILKGTALTAIFTHGPNGEYGHPRHKGVSRVLRGMLRRGEFKTRRFYVFSYRRAQGGKKALPRRNADIMYVLPPPIYVQKQRIIRNIYGFSKGSFEYGSSSQIETFKHYAIQ